MPAIYRLVLISFLYFALMSYRFYAQQSLLQLEFSSFAIEEREDRFVFKYKSMLADTKLSNDLRVAVLIFIDTSNVLLSGDSLKGELRSLELDLQKWQILDNSEVIVIKGGHPIKGSNYFEFIKSDFEVNDFPIYIMHSVDIPNWKFDNFSKFEYQKNDISGMKVIRYRMEKGSCGKFNFLRPLHDEILQLVKSISSQNTSSKRNVEMGEIKASMDDLGQKINTVTKDVQELKELISKAPASYYRFENSFRFANDFYENSLRLFYHDDDKNNNSHYFSFGLSSGELQGRTEIENYEYQNGSSIYSITGIQEHSQTKFNGVSVGYKNIKDFNGKPLELHIRGGVQFNRIASSKYHWNSGEMDVRGKLEGIGDEIINVPELGFQDNVKLAGVNGENELRRFFGSVDLDATLHYNLEKIDFFLGGGGIVSSKIQPRKTDALIFNGYQSNGLMSTVKPMALTKFYFTLGASLIF
jgi:hypothetical protein